MYLCVRGCVCVWVYLCVCVGGCVGVSVCAGGWVCFQGCQNKQQLIIEWFLLLCCNVFDARYELSL